MRYSILFMGFLFSFLTYSQSRTISKAREDFSQGKYTDGLDRLNSLSKDPSEKVIQYYYKALYFSIPNNPKYALDSAYVCADLSEQQFKLLSEKDQNSFCSEYAICINRFDYYKDSLTKEIYTELVKKKDIYGLQKYCTNYPKSSVLPLAVSKIEDLKFEKASSDSDMTLLDSFLTEYPKSKYCDQVNALREKLSYDQAVKENSIQGYQKFLIEFKNSKLKSDILNRLESLEYSRVKKENSISNYRSFLLQFPTSKYKLEIDSIVYQLGYDELIKSNDVVLLEQFLTEHPNGRYTIELNEILENKYYENAKTSSTIESLNAYCTKYPMQTARFSEISQLLEKMSFDRAKTLNTKNEWEQFIDKFPSSDRVQDAKLALSELYTIVPFLSVNGRMEFRDLQTNTTQFNEDYDMAFPFHNGKAIVQDNGKVGLIDDKGAYLITPIYDEVRSYYDGNLYVASKLKSELTRFWQGNSDDIFNQEWSESDLNLLKEYLSELDSYNAETEKENIAFRRYFGSLITEKYYSYSNFSYHNDESEFENLRENAEEDFRALDYFVYIFCKGPFSTKKVDDYSISETSIDFYLNREAFEYKLNNQVFVLEYINHSFIERGTISRLSIFDLNGTKIIREGYFNTEEDYNPGTFFLEANDGFRITKQDFNVMMPIGGQGNYFLCHQGGKYEQYKGFMWDIIGGKWGVVNKAGQIVLPFIFDVLNPVDSFDVYPYFIATINKVQPDEYNDYTETLGNVSLIDLEGKEIIPYKDGYNIIEFLNPQTIIVTKNAIIAYLENIELESSLTLGGLSGVISKDRKVILPLEFNEIYPINDCNQFIVRKGMKLIKSAPESNTYNQVGGKYSIVNRNNQYLIATPIDYLTTDLIGCIGCVVDNMGNAFNGKWGMVDVNGKTVIPFNYAELSQIDLKGIVQVNNGKTYKKNDWGFETVTEGKFGIIRNNTLMTTVKYNDIFFHDNYIEATSGNITEFYQSNCQPLPFKCDELDYIEDSEEMKSNMMAYRIGAKWGLINTNYEKITEPIFWGEIDGESNANPFKYYNGYFLVNQGGMKFYVNRKGKILKEGAN